MSIARMVGDMTQEQMLAEYWRVSRCWQDPVLAVVEHMSVERAIKTLYTIQQRAPRYGLKGRRLARMAGYLMNEVIKNQSPSEADVELENAVIHN